LKYTPLILLNMAKKVVEVVKELAFYEGVRLFKATGLNRHLPKDLEVELTHELALILLGKKAVELK
jgi:hypothetical protein